MVKHTLKILQREHRKIFKVWPFLKLTVEGRSLNVSRWHKQMFRRSRPEVFCKKVFLEISQISQENTCARLAQLFSCEFCDMLKNNFSYRTPPVAASDTSKHCKQTFLIKHKQRNHKDKN